MANLFDFFSPVFLRGLRLAAELPPGPARIPFPEDVRKKLIAEFNAQLDNIEERAVSGGKHPPDTKAASFAVVAWLDETLQLGIQEVRYGINKAGNEFFVYLNALSRQQSEVREIYYTALCLGFTGQYYYEAGEQGELGKMRETLSVQLPQQPASLPELAQEHITPQPYRLTDPGGPKLPGRSGEGLLRAAKILAVLIPLVALIVAIATRQPRLPPFSERIAQAVSIFKCAALGFDYDSAANTVTVKGRVENDGDRAQLQKAVAGLAEHPKTDVQGVALVQWPFCEVMVMLDPYAERNVKNQLGLAVAPSQHELTYKEGEDLILDIKAPVSDAYIYVDYLTKDKSVVHLLPNALQTNNLMTKSVVITIGRGRTQPGTRFWTIQPPLGTEMIAVMAFPRALFPSGRPESETATTYVSALREALSQAAADPSMTAGYFFIESR